MTDTLLHWSVLGAALVLSLAALASFLLVRRARPRRAKEPEDEGESPSERTQRLAAVGELAAAVAHDIKNPLAGISGALQVFAEDFPADDPRRDIIDEMLDKIERLDRSVKDLLRFARPAEARPVRTPMGPFLEEAARSVQKEAKRREVKVEVRAPEGHCEASVDREQMGHALAAVMLSCIESMAGGGTLTVAARRAAPSGEVEIELCHEGLEMAPEAMRDLFKPAFRSGGQEGSGLGMAISKGTIQRHGGSIAVESAPGAGTRYRIVLPSAAGEAS
jgi:signal transduction histidine kinase